MIKSRFVVAVSGSGISAAAIAAIVLNLLFNYRRGHLEEAPRSAPPSRATPRAS